MRSTTISQTNRKYTLAPLLGAFNCIEVIVLIMVIIVVIMVIMVIMVIVIIFRFRNSVKILARIC